MPDKMIKVALRSLGCPKNEADAEVMLYELLQHGCYEYTKEEAQADIIIVNTCGFIGDSAQESVDAILDAARYKEEGCLKQLIVTGCLSQRYGQTLFDELPEVDLMLGVSQYPFLHSYIQKARGERMLDCSVQPFVSNTKKRVLEHVGYAYLKIAEGCDNHCTYCTIPTIKGRYVSREKEDILEEARYLSGEGISELVVVAQDTTRYGMDKGSREIAPLLDSLARVDGIERIRLLYCYPELVDERLLDTVSAHENICNYLDIPLQHIDHDILRAMARRSSEADIRSLMELIRSKYDIALRTTFIVGFPGETRQAFDKLVKFINEVKFENLGAFMYSAEEDTKAAVMENQVQKRTKEARYRRLMLAQQTISEENLQRFVGRTLKVMADEKNGSKNYAGRAWFQSPSIDGNVFFEGHDIPLGSYVDVKITQSDVYDLKGVLL